MKRKTAPQEAWERLTKTQEMSPGGVAYISRRQFNALCQKFYRRGMERAAGVAAYASNRGVMAANGLEVEGERLIGFRMGVDYAAARVRGFISQGAKDE